MELNYQLIINYLSNNVKIKKSKNVTEIKNFNFKEINDLKMLKFYSENYDDSLIESLIYLLDDNHFFLNNSKMKESCINYKTELLINNNDEENTIIIKTCNYFKINLIVISNKIKLFSSTNIIDLSLPFILLLKKEMHYYPIFKEEKKIFFYYNTFIENLLDGEFETNFIDYQILDDLNQIIDNIIKKENTLFINKNKINVVTQLNKKTKKELIMDILEKKIDSKKSSLNQMKKNELITLLITVQ